MGAKRQKKIIPMHSRLPWLLELLSRSANSCYWKTCIALFWGALQAGSTKLLCLSCWEILWNSDFTYFSQLGKLSIPKQMQERWEDVTIGCLVILLGCCRAALLCRTHGQALGVVVGWESSVLGRCCIGRARQRLSLCCLFIVARSCWYLVAGFAAAQTRLP